MKKKVLLGLILSTGLTIMPTNVTAKGMASINFRSEDNIIVGENFKVYMSVENVKDVSEGVISLGGKLIFDENKIEYISAKNLNTPYEFIINPAAMKLAGVDYTLENGILNNTDIFEFTFKAKEIGETSITLDKAITTDSNDYLDTTVNSAKLTITELPKDEKTNKAELKKEIIQKTVKKTVVKEETHKEKLVKVNEAVHSLLKKISKLF